MKRTCELCLITSENVHEQSFYDKVLGRDSTRYVCDDIQACLDRQGFYSRYPQDESKRLAEVNNKNTQISKHLTKEDAENIIATYFKKHQNDPDFAENLTTKLGAYFYEEGCEWVVENERSIH